MSAISRRVDALIVGQGLAGSFLARALLARNRTILVIDRENPSAASRVAAGLVTPVTGRKMVKSWRADTLIPFAENYYRSWEREIGEQVYWEKKIWRFFQSPEEAAIWEAKREDPAFAGYASPLPENAAEALGLQPQIGGFCQDRAAHLDARGLLRAFRTRLREQGALAEEAYSAPDLRIEANGVQWRDVAAKRIFFCEGHAASGNPFFSWIPFRHAKGEILALRGPKVPEDLVLNRGKWLLPVGDGIFRAGATYEWEDLTEIPTASGRDAILDDLRELLSQAPEVMGHEAGVRPIVKDMRPVAGLHPAYPAVGIFNGLGSKGVLWGPFFAEQLAEHLETGAPLDPLVDVRRNL